MKKPPNANLLVSITLLTVLFVLTNDVVAEIRVITGFGEYRMGDMDTRSDAKRLALLDAKRAALEQTGVYIESTSEVKAFNLTRDEVRAYTAGLVEVLEETVTDTMEGATHTIRVKARVVIDTDIVASQMGSLRNNQAATIEILRLRNEAERLFGELAALKLEHNSALAGTNLKKVEYRNKMVEKAESNSLLSRVWSLLDFWKGPVTESSLNEAKVLAEKAKTLDPESSDAHAALGYIYYRYGELDKARRAFQEALRLDNGNITAHHYLGHVFFDLKQFADAAIEFEQRIRLGSETDRNFYKWQLLSAYEKAGEQLQSEGNLKAAANYFNKEIQVDPSMFYGHLLLGNCLLQMGEMDAAIVELRVAVGLHPNFAGTHFALAEALKTNGNLTAAINEYRMAFEISPDFGNGYAQNQFGLALLQAGHAQESIYAFRAALKSRPDEANLYHSLGKALAKLGQFSDAIVQYRTVLSMKPENPMALNDLGVALSMTGALESALNEIKKAVTLRPDEPWFHFNAGCVLFDMGRYEHSALELREAIRLRIGEPAVHYYLGSALKALGARPDSIREFREFLKLVGSGPGNPQFVENANAAIRASDYIEPNGTTTDKYNP